MIQHSSAPCAPRFLAVLATLAAGLLALWWAPSAHAAPEITLDKQAPATVLFGEESEVTLRAANPSAEHGYNLSFRDVLPAGVSYVADSSSAVAPRVIEDAPNEGETTLIFENLVDLSPNSSYDLRYRVSHSTTLFQIGDTYENEADAYVSEDPHLEPVFDAKGLPEHNVDGEAGDSAVTEISAIEIEKNGSGPAEKLLRGAHDFQTVYNLVVRNNSVEPTTGVVVEDWLPAGLEFLGCGSEDNTTDAFSNPDASKEEYPGSGLLNPGNAPAAPKCVAPNLVETVNADPDGAGPMPSGVYTHVVWNAFGAMEVSGKIELQYVAAVPIRENTTTWTGVEPTAASGEQGSNLDNNSGTETFHDQALTNYAVAKGSYDGTLAVQAHDTSTKVAKDVVVDKSVNTDVIDHGQISKWTLRVQASEYRYVKNLRITDTLPNGLCPLGSQNFEKDVHETEECDPTGDNPTIPYTEATENEDGSYTLKWDETTVPGLSLLEPTQTFTVEFPTKTRVDYQEDFEGEKPVLAEDSWENTVTVAGADYRICAPGEPVCAVEGTGEIDGEEANGTDDGDSAAASQHAAGITIEKQIREREPLSIDCKTGTYVDGPEKYRAGDQICWLLHVEFPGKLDTGEPTVTDFLPPGTTYVPGSEEKTTANTVEGVAFDDTQAALGLLTWTFGGDVVPGKVFEVRFRTVVGQAVSDRPGLLKGNLMKFSYENSTEVSFPARDEAEFVHSQPLLDLKKGVLDVNDGPPVHEPPIDNVQVAGEDVVTYRIDVENEGDLAAEGAEVWDNLEDGITCTDVVEGSISDGGSCTGTQIKWTGLSVTAEATKALTYDVEIPAGVEPGRQFHDEAGVVSYASETNTGEDQTYVPAENIDPSKTEPNAPAADDGSSVHTRGVTITKTRSTEIGEPGNELSDEATIGERVDYVVKIVVPEGTTIYGSPKFSDPLGERQTYSASPAVEATLNGAALEEPPFELKAEGNEVSLQFPTEYASGSGDDTFEIKFSATVADAADNKRTGTKLKNTGTFTWEHQGDTTKKTQSAHVETTIVEPDVAVAKADDDADDVVEPGQTVNYTITASNPNGTDVSMAHDLVLVDLVPLGLTPTEGAPGGGIWDETKRTITWGIGSLEPGQQVQRSYAVEVDDPAVVDQTFTNTADLTATSMPGAVSGERSSESPFDEGYFASAEAEVRIGDATLTKSVLPGDATIGEQVTYTTEVTFPANVSYFDATVIDTLPDGLVYDETVDVICNSGGCSGAHTELGPDAGLEGTNRVAWFLGDLTNEPIDRTYQIVYKAHVAIEYFDEAPVTGGETLTNTAAAFYNASSEMGVPASVPDPSEFTGTSGPDSAEVEVVEPAVAIEKKVSGDGDEDGFRTTEAGETYTYSLVVENTGTAPAYDIEVTDTFDPSQLVNVSVPPGPEVVDGDGSDGEIGWLLPGPLLPGQKATLTYEADLAESAQLSQGEDILNTARVPHFWGAPKAERDANTEVDYRDYKDTPPDSVTLEVLLPSLEVEKTVGDDSPGGDVAEIGEPFAWRVVVTNPSQAIAKSVDVHDTLPANWEYVANSAEFTPGGKAEPAIATDPGGDTLTWANRGDLAPSGELVLTFEAVPTVAAAGDPGPGANVNEADAAADDASGAGASFEEPYADEDEAQATLALPQLNVVKTPDGGTIDAGEAGTYTIEVSNTGTVPAREVVVTDVLGPNQTYAAGSATAVPPDGFSETSVTPGPGAGEDTIEWALEEIGPGESVTITLPIATSSSLPEGTELLNDASVASREITTPDSDEGTIDVEVDSDVEIVKLPQGGTVDAGDEMDFTLTVRNNGPSDAVGVLVEDQLPANLSFVSAEAPCGQVGGLVSCPIGPLAAGASEELTLRVKVSPDETVEVSNEATVSSTTPDSEPDNNESTATKPVSVAANVRVQKDGPAAPVLQGTTFEYVIEVLNDGVSTATEVTLSDPLPEGVSFVSGETNLGDCFESGDTVDCNFGDLEPGEDAVVTIRALAEDVGIWNNVATGATDSVETNPSDNADNAEVEVVPAADLGVTKSAPATVEPGTELSYALEVVNNGPSEATGVSLVDTLPVGVHVVAADPACSHAAGEVTCVVGNLGVTETRSFTITVVVPYALGGKTLTNFVVVEGNEGDLVTENDSDQATTTVGPAADLTIAKTAGGATAGDSASWTLAIHNNGPSPAPVHVKDSLPAGTSLRSATPSQGSCGAAGAEVTCDLGILAVGGNAQIVVLADVAAGTEHQQLRNRGSVSGPHPDPDLTNNEAEATSTISPPPPSGGTVSAANLKLIKTASEQRPQLGKPFSYKLLIENNGGGDAKVVRVVDTPSKAVEVKQVTPSQGKCSENGGATVCSLGTIRTGGEVVVKLVVVPTAPGDLRNTASASAANGADANSEDNLGVAGVRVMSPRGPWELAKRASRRVVRGGEAVRFAITVRVGKKAIAGARVCDVLPAGLIFVRVPGASFDRGRACWSFGYLPAGARRKMRVVTRAERGFGVRRVRNVALAKADNAARRTAGARVRVNPAFGGAGGGVTG